MLLRAEAWTLPTSASFEKITDVPMLAGSSGSRELSSYSDNTLIVNSTWAGFDDIRKSLIRIFDGDTVIDEHEVKRIAKSPRRPTQFQVSGPQANGLVEKLLIYPRTESLDAQDWIWDGENQLPPLTLADLNSVNEEWHLHTVSDPFALTVDGQATSSLSTPTSVQLEAALQALSNVNDVTVDGTGADADNPFVIIFYDPPDPTTVTVSTGTGTLDKQQEGGLSASPITHSQYADRRVDDAVHGTYGTPPIIPITESNLDTDATWALQVNAEGQFAGSQILISVTPGQTYQASIRVKPSVDAKYRLVIRDIFENLIKATTPFEVSLTAGTYQTLSISDIVIPAGVTEVIMRVAVVSDDPGEIDTFWVNWEAAIFAEGMAATTFTQIVRLLIEDAQERGAYEFLDLDFTDPADTAGNALPNESFTAFAFSNMGHVMADGSDLGYKWRLRPKATPAGALTHDLQIYLEGEVEDLTSSSGGPTVQTGSVDDAAVVSRSPDFTVALGWGANGLYTEVEDAALVADYGRIERVFDAEHLASVESLERMLDEKFREQAENEDALSAEVPGDAQRVPFIDYAEGSKIWWAFPDEGVEKVAKTVRRVSWTHGNTVSFTLQASEVLSEQAGMARAMHHLLRKFERRRRQRNATPRFGGGGGIPDVVLAAADTGQTDTADLFSSDFVSDDLMMTAALGRLGSREGGWIHLLEGEYSWNGEVFHGLDRVVKVTGAGRNVSVIKVADSANFGAVFRVGSGFTAAGGFTFEDLTIDGNGDFATVTDLLHFSGGSQAQIHMTRARVRNGSGNGVNIQRPGGTGVNIARLTDMESVGNGGQGLIAREVDFKAIDCSFSDNGSDGVDVGFGGKRTFTGCDINDNGGKGVTNAGLSGGTGRCTMVGNTVNGNTGDGIDLNHFNALPTVIVANTVQNNGGLAIDAFPGSIVGLNLVSGNGDDTVDPPQIGSSQQQVVPWSQIGQLAVTAGSHKYVLPDDVILVSARAAVGTVEPVGADVVVDVNLNGTSAFTTKPTVPDGTAVGAKVTATTTEASEGDYLTVDIDQVGSTTPGEDLTVMVELLWLTG